jgi:hypothetical protein
MTQSVDSSVRTTGAKVIEMPPSAWRDKVMHKCRESVEVKEKFFELYADQIAELSQKMAVRFQDGRHLWVMGNGGSA